ncbi:deoxynucleoside kinase [Candidatus Babeliales bacterium]|nr:deoxynucleoside kinase [Candidatus Babeliales bacterium]
MNKKIFFFTTTYLFFISLTATTPPCFFIEGATGVGKTTFVQLLEKNLPNVTAVYEPVETFFDVNGAGNMLELFWSNPQRWTFTTNAYISLMHLQAAENRIKDTTASVAFVDRSLYADCYVYGKMAHLQGTMNDLEWEILQQLTNWLGTNGITRPRGFIYLQTSPQTALDRVRARSRTGEEVLSLQYEELLDTFYREWFVEQKDIPSSLAQVPVLIIDATQNFKDDPIVQQQCIDQVKAFIEKLL